MYRRIICIVDNGDSQSKGLIKFCRENVFTRKFLFKKETQETDSGETTTLMIPLLNANTCYLLISKEKGVALKNVVQPNDEWDILLIHDSVLLMNDSEFLWKKGLLVMYHNKPDNAKTFLQTKNVFGKQGQHENLKDRGYVLLNDIFEAWQENDSNGNFDIDKFDIAFKQIADWFYPEKLEIILTFLHDYNDNLKLPKDADYSILEKAGIKEAELKNKLSGIPPNSEWSESLSKLRNELLEEHC